MEHFFNLSVCYKDEVLHLQSRLVTFGYSYRFDVVVGKFELQVERDEQMHFRILNYDREAAIEQLPN